MDDDSEHKVDDSDDGWVLDSEQIWKEESEIVSESDGNTAMLLLKCEHFYQVVFLPRPNFAPLSPSVTWARGSDSLRITWYKKG